MQGQQREIKMQNSPKAPNNLLMKMQITHNKT